MSDTSNWDPLQCESELDARKREAQFQPEHDRFCAEVAAVGTPRCWDWMLTSGATHYCRDRAFFKTYVPVTGTAEGAPVVGIGAVEIIVPRSPSPEDGTTTLILQRVLHIPSAICNGICTRIQGYSQYFRDTPTQGIVHQVNDEQGNPYYYGTRFCGVGNNRLIIANEESGVSGLWEASEGGVKPLDLGAWLTSDEKDSIINERDGFVPLY